MTTDDQFLADLQYKSNLLHRLTVDADRPPSGMWEGILTNVTQTKENQEDNAMNTLSIQPSSLTSPEGLAGRRAVFRFFNSAVSVAIIAAIAFGGWFAAMQLNEPDGPTPNPRYAAIATPAESSNGSATPQAGAATCDVEPLTAERVVEIVENPFRFIANGPAGEQLELDSSSSVYNTELYEADIWDASLEPQEDTQPPSKPQFQSASEVADAYLECLLVGTVGQVWTFYNPVYIQQEVLAAFPVYSDKDSVRTWIEDQIDKPAYLSTASIPWDRVISIYEPQFISVNPDPALAISQSSFSYQFDKLVTFGVHLEDSDGKVVYLTSGTGNQMVSLPQSSTFNLRVMVAHQTQHDVWYVVPFWHP